MHTPSINILAYPTENGIIHGRMDWHSPDFFINSWSQCGLKLAADTAELLGYDELKNKWSEMATAHSKAMIEHLIPEYGNKRDSIITPYPSNALTERMDI